MIYLFTGTPGASKTLNAIKFVNEDDTFAIFEDGVKTDKRRPVYYFNIRDVKLPWSELSLDEAMKWFDLPFGSVIIFDEAYDVFPQRLRGEAPEQVKKLATHRHNGYDIVIITQKVGGQIDSFVRGLIELHYHFDRRFGTQLVTRYQFQKCCENVNDYHARKQAQAKQITIDKKYFVLYHSAEVHTVKANVPWKRFAVIPLLLIIAVALVWYGVSTVFGGDRLPDETAQTKSSNENSSFFPKASTAEKITFEQYVAQYQPRIEGLPHTAPVYDDVSKPKTYPKLACIIWRPDTEHETCKCITQQGTTTKVPISTCKNLANNGYFDPAKEDREQIAERNQRDEMQYRVAMDTAARAGLNPVEEYEKHSNRTVIGNRRPYDHFFSGTGVERTASSSGGGGGDSSYAVESQANSYSQQQNYY